VELSKEIVRLEHSAIKLSVTVAKADVRAQYDELIASYAKNVQLPGFRKGKVPREVLERKFGESLKGELVGRVMEKAIQELMEAEDFPAESKPIAYSTPSVTDEPQLDFDRDLSFSVTYDAFPAVQVGNYKGLEIETPLADIGSEDLNRELDQIRERNAIVLDKDDGEKAVSGDVVTVSYSELDEEGAVIGGTERQDYVFTLGTGMNVYKFDAEITGLKKGQTKDFEKSYPADFEDAELAGKTKRLRATVSLIKTKKLPDLDDDLAQDVNEKYKTLADLKADIQARLQKTADKRIRELNVAAVLEKIMAATPIDLPESMIRAEQDMRWRDMARRFNTDSDQLLKILASSGKTYENLMAEWRPDVEKGLKSRLIVETLIKDLGLEAGEAELEAEMQTMAAGMDVSVDEVKKYYEQENMKEYLLDSIKENRLFDRLLAESKIKKGKKQKYLDLVGNNG